MLLLLILSLITWRVSYALVNEDGPDDIIYRFRMWTLSSKWSPLNCVYCTTVWVGILIAIIAPVPFYYGIAFSALAILFEVIHERLDR